MEYKINADGIGKLAKQASKEYRQSGRFFERGGKFDENRFIQFKKRQVVSNLFKELKLDEGYKIDEKERMFNVLLANIFWLWENPSKTRRPVVVSLSPNYWAKKTSVTDQIIKQIKRLKEHGYIKMKKGHHFENSKKRPRIWPTKKLLNYFPKSPMIKYEPVQLIELRELDSQKLLDYRDTAYSRKRRKELKAINKVNSDAEIWHPFEGQIQVYFKSIFKKNFSLYGRLHTMGDPSIQGLPSEERRRLSIAGEPAAELDFSALHPHLVYAIEGIQCSNDPYLAGGQNPVLRELFKIMFMAILNSATTDEVFKAVNHWLYKNPAEKKKLIKAGIIPHHEWVKEGPKENWYRRKPSVKKYITPLIDEFMNIHKPISDHFLAGKKQGLRIMFKDSEIAVRVLKHFTGKGVPCLSVHDSFIVPKSYEAELKEVMQDKYKQVSKGFSCPVKREYQPMELTEDSMIGLKTEWRKVS